MPMEGTNVVAMAWYVLAVVSLSVILAIVQHMRGRKRRALPRVAGTIVLREAEEARELERVS